MVKLKRLTLAEEELMLIFWKTEKPLTSVEILGQTKDKTWTGNYLHKMLRTLEVEKFLKVCGMQRYGRQYARLFVPIVSQADYTVCVLKQQRINVKSLAKVALAFAKDENDTNTSVSDTNRLIAELEDIIAELRTGQDE